MLRFSNMYTYARIYYNECYWLMRFISVLIITNYYNFFFFVIHVKHTVFIYFFEIELTARWLFIFIMKRTSRIEMPSAGKLRPFIFQNNCYSFIFFFLYIIFIVNWKQLTTRHILSTATILYYVYKYYLEILLIKWSLFKWKQKKKKMNRVVYYIFFVKPVIVSCP